MFQKIYYEAQAKLKPYTIIRIHNKKNKKEKMLYKKFIWKINYY